MNTTKQIFFDLLALSDMERIHSATIAWLLSDECNALDIVQRSYILNSLFGLPKDRAIYTKSEMRLEWEGIDILWITENEKGEKECWVLENKIKSSQHSNQLVIYQNKVEQIFTNLDKHYSFLTLTGEYADILNINKGYYNYTYTELVSQLKPYFSDNHISNNSDWIIANEYFKAIQQMTKTMNNFLDNHTKYPRVFKDGNKKKQKKLESYKGQNLTEDDIYIAQKGMETIMQRYLFLYIVKDIISNFDDHQIKRWEVVETHGNADMHFYFENYMGRGSKEGDTFDLSFQSGTFKFAVSYKYLKATGKSKKNRDDLKDAWKDIFSDLKTKYNYERSNDGKSHSRISISYSIKSPSQWYELERNVLVDIIRQELIKAITMRAEAIKKYEEIKVK